MNSYIYRDNRETPPTVVFECRALSIIGADKQYQKATGKNVVKQPYIGCESVRIPKKNTQKA